MSYFTKAIAESKGSRVGTFMRMLTEEMIEESAIVPPEILEFYMQQAAAVLYWTATGETVINMPMPHDFRHTIPRELINDTKALPPGTNDDSSVENIDSLY